MINELPVGVTCNVREVHCQVCESWEWVEQVKRVKSIL